MEKKKIAFIEMETHSALLEQWYFLLIAMPSISFHFFVHPKVKEKISSIPDEFITIGDSVEDFPIGDFDGVVINTFHRNFRQYKEVLKSKPVLCLVHNVNFSLFFNSISPSNFKIEKERFVYYLKLYLKEGIAWHRRQILQAKWFGVLSPRIKYETEKRSSFKNKLEVVQLNYCRSSNFPSTDTIEIVIPGNVSNKRKDIDLVFAILKKLKPKSKLNFTFLGKPENDVILQGLEDLRQKCDSNISIVYYDRFIPWEEYSQVVSKAHLLLCPVRHKTSFYWVSEYYGKTKVSGSEADCIYNGKIGVFPSAYPKMDWHNWYYNSKSDLTKLLTSLSKEKLEEGYAKLEFYRERYTFENVKSNLEQQLIELTQK